MRRRIFSVLVVFLIVTSGMATPAAAATTSDQCSELDKFIHQAISVWTFGFGEGAVCDTDTNEALQEMRQSDANQTKVDIYSVGAAEAGNNEVFNSVYGNYLNDSGSPAWMAMQTAVAEAYQAGKSKQQAIVAARQAISNYYATKQKNLIEEWNTTVSTHQYLHETATNETNISSKFVYWEDPGSADTYQPSMSYKNGSVGLVNGNTSGVRIVHVEVYWENNGPSDTDTGTETVDYRPGVNPNMVAHVGGDAFDSFYDGKLASLSIEPANSNYDRLILARTSKYNQRWNKIQTLNSDLQNEAENFVNATYADFDSGAINASDVISANTAMFEYGVRSGNQSESLYSSTAALATMGFDVPNMSTSGTMDVTYNGNTYTGLVLARHAPGGSWQAGTTYNTSNISGPVFLATTDGNKVDIPDGETFTIDQMRAKDGSNVTMVNTTTYVYKTANTSQWVQMQQQLSDLRKEVEARQAAIGGGGSGSGLNSQTIIALIAVAGAALLLGRNDQ